MLSKITIENVAVIEKATATFGDGLNVLTGETGAGKSILIDSINAILGSRTSRDIVRTGTQKAAIWAAFSALSSKVQTKLADAGYEAGGELLLYREISAEGKSVCRINGMPATAAAVRDICADLINIHGQHDNQSLLDPAKHLGILDAFAKNEKQHENYYAVYRELVKIKREIKTLSMNEEDKEKRTEFLTFQLDAIDKAQLKDGEEEQLEAQKKLVLHAQSITERLTTAYAVLNGGDDYQGAVEMLGNASTSVEALHDISDEFRTLSERTNELYYTAKELAEDISDMSERFVFDPAELDLIEERLDLIYRLKQKYGASIAEILAYREKAAQELEAIQLGSERLDELYEKQASLFEQAKQLANVLTDTRLKAFERFDAQMTKELSFLNMPGIRFSLEHKSGALASMGQDSIEFYISTNRGEAPKPLAKIASGGELSRIMLAVKSTLADIDDIGTVIYDEIDTGVSGLAAARIGEKLKQTAHGRQVICITHTAQIAAQADVHLLIEKNIEADRTFTVIDTLDSDGRVRELARMISGDKITDTSLANAREMLTICST